ncbi:MAG: 50S ribosomal protein L11 methyltransferase [Proteobacteria bacterium]|nr:50S ribosomal protein L11 methyltransferase [Pseudomonadota bacterium]
MQDNQVYPGLTVHVPSDADAEMLAYDLSDLGALAVETRDAETMHRAPDSRTLLIAGFASVQQRQAAIRALTADHPALEIVPVDIKDDGWRTGWQAFFQPVVLQQLQVLTPWMSAPPSHRRSLIIDPGQAFGTGGHATTVLLLQMIEARAASGKLPKRVLDVGIGSGILAIACALLGAEQVTGVDIEEAAIVAVRENAARNQVADNITALLGGPEVLRDTWPLVLANIQLSVFEQTADHMRPLVAPAGEILISGLLVPQVDACLALWPGFRAAEVRTEGEWAAIALERLP